MKIKSPVLWFFLLVAVIAGYATFGPAEQSLGTNVRVVYLHGAWVWTALIGILAAGASGGLALVTRSQALHRWSGALGRTGAFFWLTYLPLSLWAMETNWNGLFLAEPRWRVAIVFAIGGLGLQVFLAVVKEPSLGSLGNLLYAAGLMVALSRTGQVMHPSSPILESDALRIQIFFGGLTLLALLAAWQMTRWWFQLARG